VILERTFQAAVCFLLLSATACGKINNPGFPPDEFSSGNFSMNIVASGSCTTLADAGRNRTWKMGLEKTRSEVVAWMEGWGDSATVFSQTTLTGSATGSSLMLTGAIYDTIAGCTQSLCYRAEGAITATQSGNVIYGTLSGVLTYDSTTCPASDHKVTFTRQ
jgi:hypothetical protein